MWYFVTAAQETNINWDSIVHTHAFSFYLRAWCGVGSQEMTFIFRPCWVFVGGHELSLVSASVAYSLVGVQASHCGGFSCCRIQAQQLQPTGLAPPQQVESFQIRDQTHVPFIGWQILSHWTTREVQKMIIGEFTSWHPAKLNLSNSNENLPKNTQLILP